jgi:hypothetical protein
MIHDYSLQKIKQSLLFNQIFQFIIMKLLIIKNLEFHILYLIKN